MLVIKAGLGATDADPFGERYGATFVATSGEVVTYHGGLDTQGNHFKTGHIFAACERNTHIIVQMCELENTTHT